REGPNVPPSESLRFSLISSTYASPLSCLGSVLQLQFVRPVETDHPQCLAPREDLIKHGGHGRLAARAGVEETEILKVRKYRQQDLSADGRHVQLGQNQPEVFDRARSVRVAPVGDEARGLVIPFAEQEVDGILQRAWNAMVVFRRDKHEGVKLG